MPAEKNLYSGQVVDPRVLDNEDTPEFEIDLVELMYRMI